MMKTFCTILPINEPVSIFKDPGMIPLGMKRLGWNAEYVSFAQLESYPVEYLQYVDGLNIVRIKDDRNGKVIRLCSKSIMKFIWENAKKIDVLHLYFMKYSILYALAYKFRHPHGFVYLKLDFNIYDCILRSKETIEPIRKFVYKRYMKYIPDLISVEQKKGLDFIKQYYGLTGDKFCVSPNGVDDALFARISINIPEERENKILIVGRIGAYVKNHEIILDALEKVNTMGEWHVEFVGPVESVFMKRIDAFYTSRPDLSDRVKFIGPITDRLQLFQKYNKSKVLCMSSRSEGFALAYAEAQVFGNYIISTEVSSIDDLIGDNPHLGLRFADSNELSHLLDLIFSGNIPLDEYFDERLIHGSRFLWSNICSEIDKRIMSRMGG